jgi:hypothetical protein
MADFASASPQRMGLVSDPRFVEWGAVFAGGVMAAAISFVLLTFGTTIGLSFTSQWASAGLSAKAIASLAAFWTMASQIGAAMIGGYVAGRMRSRMGEIAEHEVEFRDGLHGGLVWAIGVSIGAGLLFAAVHDGCPAGEQGIGQRNGHKSNWIPGRRLAAHRWHAHTSRHGGHKPSDQRW